MTEEWLIDGYNLFHWLNSGTDGKSKISQERLCDLLSDFASIRNFRVLMVFDGVGDNQEFASFRSDTFEAVYSQELSADSWIEKHVVGSKSRLSIVVVTNDRAVSDLARGAGARVISARSLLEDLQKARKENKNVLFKQQVRTHGFNRPFENKL